MYLPVRAMPLNSSVSIKLDAKSLMEATADINQIPAKVRRRRAYGLLKPAGAAGLALPDRRCSGPLGGQGATRSERPWGPFYSCYIADMTNQVTPQGSGPDNAEALDLAGKHIVLGLSGGIACYKAAELCRALIKAGATVQVVMTEAAEQFITPVTLQALSGRPVYTSQWDSREDNNMAHINLSRESDAILIAPMSADFMAKLLHGRADDLLSLMCLARPIDKVPLLVAPAMNREMYAHPATQRNFVQLDADGATVLGVGSGFQACGETGDGRMLEPAELLQDIVAFL